MLFRSTEVAKMLEEITTAATKVNGLVGEISAASTEQAQGIEQVNTAVSQMDKVTQSNAANAEESASASEELASQAEQMKNMVNELIAMVNGASATSNSMSRRPGTPQPAKAATAASKRAASMIPLDDHETRGNFSDFSKAA